jgi:hypothetical protein
MWMPEGNVGGHGIAEEKTLLKHQAHVAPQIVQVEIV